MPVGGDVGRSDEPSMPLEEPTPRFARNEATSALRAAFEAGLLRCLEFGINPYRPYSRLPVREDVASAGCSRQSASVATQRVWSVARMARSWTSFLRSVSTERLRRFGPAQPAVPSEHLSQQPGNTLALPWGEHKPPYDRSVSGDERRGDS